MKNFIFTNMNHRIILYIVSYYRDEELRVYKKVTLHSCKCNNILLIRRIILYIVSY